MLSGTVTMDFMIDGLLLQKAFSSPTGAIPFNNQPNYLYINVPLLPGNHTLVMKLSAAMGTQMFSLDYLLFNASFQNIGAEPTLTTLNPTSTLSSTSVGNPLPASNGSASAPTASIAGGVVGGVLALLTLLLLLWWRRCKKMKHHSREVIDEWVPAGMIMHLALG
jgi:hypothetical protein